MSKFGNFERRFEANNMLHKLVDHIEHQVMIIFFGWLRLWPCLLNLRKCDKTRIEGFKFWKNLAQTRTQKIVT
jgi:hypothetical protein